MENVYDNVLNGVQKRVEAAAEKISVKFKGVKPFNQEPIPKKELLSAYLGLKPEDMSFLIQKHGREKVNDFVFDMEMRLRG